MNKKTKIVVEPDLTPEELVLAQIKTIRQAIENYLKTRLGWYSLHLKNAESRVRNAEGRYEMKPYADRGDYYQFELETDNEVTKRETDGIWVFLMKEYQLNMSVYLMKDSTWSTRPHLSYSHQTGGCNGCEMNVKLKGQVAGKNGERTTMVEF